MEREEDGVQEGEGSAERVTNSYHGLGSVSVDPGHNSGENGIGDSVWCVSILDSRHGLAVTHLSCALPNPLWTLTEEGTPGKSDALKSSKKKLASVKSARLKGG